MTRVPPRESQGTETHSDLRRQRPSPICLGSRNRPVCSWFGCTFVSFYGFFFWIPVFHVPYSSRQGSNFVASGFSRELQSILGWRETVSGALVPVFLPLCSGSRARLSAEVCAPCSLRSKASSSAPLLGLVSLPVTGEETFLLPV